MTDISCAICFEQVDTIYDHRICLNSDDPSHTPICKTCMIKHIELSVSDMYNGICKPIFCPTCVDKQTKPILKFSSGWKDWKLLQHTKTQYLRLAQNLVTFRCNNCHNDNCYDPATQTNNFQPINDDPDLMTILTNYCHNKIDIFTAYNYISQYSNDNNIDIIKLIASIENPERRINLFLKHMKIFPYVYSNCCKFLHCFRCKMAMMENEDHVCDTLENSNNMNDIAQCPNCSIVLVKSDGCDQIRCLCGTAFSWNNQLTRYKANAFILQFPIDTNFHCARLLIEMSDSSDSLNDSPQKIWYNAHTNDVNPYLIQLYLKQHPQYPIEAYLSSWVVKNRWLKLGGKLYTDQIKMQDPIKWNKITQSLSLACSEQLRFNNLLVTTTSVKNKIQTFLFLCGKYEPQFKNSQIFHQNDVQKKLYESINLWLKYGMFIPFVDDEKNEYSKHFSQMFSDVKKFEDIVDIDKIITSITSMTHATHHNVAQMKLFSYVDDNKIFFRLGKVTFLNGCTIKSTFKRDKLTIVSNSNVIAHLRLNSYRTINVYTKNDNKIKFVLFRPSETSLSNETSNNHNRGCKLLKTYKALRGSININNFKFQKPNVLRISFVIEPEREEKMNWRDMARIFYGNINTKYFVGNNNMHTRNLLSRSKTTRSMTQLIADKICYLENYTPQLISLRLFANFCSVYMIMNKLVKVNKTPSFNFSELANLSDIVKFQTKITWHLIICAKFWYIENKIFLDNILYCKQVFDM